MNNENEHSVKPAEESGSSEGWRTCAYCGSRAPLVWVHGHGQCASCGINIEECCQGEISAM